ncbi:MAG: prepilin-type N-terminal cleavage/methylation domain-containing protein [Acidobacteriota bacterium]
MKTSLRRYDAFVPPAADAQMETENRRIGETGKRRDGEAETRRGGEGEMGEGRRPGCARRAGAAGFTLIELLVVVSLIGILAGIAVGQYRYATLKAKEAVLREDLYQLRHLIDQYYADKKKYPQSLENLVEGGYIKKIPTDPITESSATWVVVREEIKPEDQETTAPVEGAETPPEPGIIDVKSGAEKLAIDGTPYNEW